uniref:Uncharacterized protein n=1 Tax=Cacopsylla melanoneura TaxID=428564 RepID=A0A8D8M1J9_9HEMI
MYIIIYTVFILHTCRSRLKQRIFDINHVAVSIEVSSNPKTTLPLNITKLSKSKHRHPMQTMRSCVPNHIVHPEKLVRLHVQLTLPFLQLKISKPQGKKTQR